MTQRTSLAQQMLAHVSHQQESGMSVARYAAQIGITAHKLRYWIKKSRSPQRAFRASDSEMAFINLGRLDLPIAPSNGHKASGCDMRQPQITLTLPNGMCLNIY